MLFLSLIYKQISPVDYVQYSNSCATLTFLSVLQIGFILAATGNAGELEQAPDPHGDPALCSRCHISVKGRRAILKFDGDAVKLCRSCHDGKLSAGEAHPVGMAPKPAIAARMKARFPLEDGMLGCLTCHDVTWHCSTSRQSAFPRRGYLRGAAVSHPMEFCFQCHNPENYRPFNAHDQIENGRTKTDVCGWCHSSIPDVDSRLKEDASYALRSKSSGVCNNCHIVKKDHPTGNQHLNAKLSAEMKWHISAYELQSRMNLPFKQLLEYVKAAKRSPRLIPLDKKGRIACYSCHNPHEKGLLPDWNLRSVGAEPKQATNHRLRTYGNVSCRTCHDK